MHDPKTGLVLGQLCQQKLNVLTNTQFILGRVIEDVEGDLIANTTGTQEVI